jgi:hypothetical protein
MVTMLKSKSQKRKENMGNGITSLTKKRLAQIAPEKTTVYVAWLSTAFDSGWGWGLEEDTLEFISYDTSEKYDSELDNMAAGYVAHDPNVTDELLIELIKEDETFPTELKNSAVFDIDKSMAPEEHPYDDGSTWKRICGRYCACG